MWVKSLLTEYKMRIDDSVIIHGDNRSATVIANNDRYQIQAKHINMGYHFFLKQIMSKKIKLQYIETKSQLADFLTKPVWTKKFEQLLIRSNAKNLSSRESVEPDVPQLG